MGCKSFSQKKIWGVNLLSRDPLDRTKLLLFPLIQIKVPLLLFLMSGLCVPKMTNSIWCKILLYFYLTYFCRKKNKIWKIFKSNMQKLLLRFELIQNTTKIFFKYPINSLSINDSLLKVFIFLQILYFLFYLCLLSI